MEQTIPNVRRVKSGWNEYDFVHEEKVPQPRMSKNKYQRVLIDLNGIDDDFVLEIPLIPDEDRPIEKVFKNEKNKFAFHAKRLNMRISIWKGVTKDDKPAVYIQRRPDLK